MSRALSRFIKLDSGRYMPTLGLGTFESWDDDAQTAVDCALSVGYRHIDTAKRYNNERAIGQVLKDRLCDGKIKRKDLFITTKIPGPLLGSEREVTDGVLESLENLQLPWVDMLLIHSPWGYREVTEGGETKREFVNHDLFNAWQYFEKIYKDGYTRGIGLSNVTRSQLHRIYQAASVKPSNVQLECHAYYQQTELREYCHRHGIVVTAYSPLGSPNRPPRYREPNTKELLHNPVVQNIADNIKKTPGQVLVRYIMQLGLIPLPKSANPGRIQENFDCYDFSLDSATMRELEQLDCGIKYFKFTWAQGHPEYFDDQPF